MYALAVIRYLKPLDELLVHLAAHRAYLRELEAAGFLLASYELLHWKPVIGLARLDAL